MTQDPNSDTQTGDTDKASEKQESSGEPKATQNLGKQRPGKQSPDKQSPNKRSSNKEGRSGVWLTVLVLVVLLAASAYGFWYIWQGQQLGQEQRHDQTQGGAVQSEQLSHLQNQIETLRQRLERQPPTQLDPARLRQELSQNLEQQVGEQLEQQAQERRQALATLQERLNNTDRKLNAITGTNRQDWKLAEAEYLLRLANQRLLMENDASNALALAQAADQILNDLNNSDLFAIRRALARDINALKLADEVDKEGIYLHLMALSEQLDKLPLIEPMARGEPIDGEQKIAPPGPEAGAWAKIKYQVGHSFQGLQDKLSDHLRIRRHEKPIEPLATPAEQFYLRQNLRLMLEQAQVALLREQPEIFSANLKRAADWLKRYYTLNPKTQSVQEELLDLASISISQPLPDLSEPLSRLQAHIKRLHRVSEPDSSNEPQNAEEGEGA